MKNSKRLRKSSEVIEMEVLLPDGTKVAAYSYSVEAKVKTQHREWSPTTRLESLLNEAENNYKIIVEINRRLEKVLEKLNALNAVFVLKNIDPRLVELLDSDYYRVFLDDVEKIAESITPETIQKVIKFRLFLDQYSEAYKNPYSDEIFRITKKISERLSFEVRTEELPFNERFPYRIPKAKLEWYFINDRIGLYVYIDVKKPSELYSWLKGLAKGKYDKNLQEAIQQLKRRAEGRIRKKDLEVAINETMKRYEGLKKNLSKLL